MSNYDVYPTNVNIIEFYLKNFTANIFPKYLTDKCKVADLGANDGIWGNILKKYYSNIQLYGCDIRELNKPELFDVWESGENGNIYNLDGRFSDFDIIIGNPPFTNVIDWLDITMNKLADNGMMAYLLLSNTGHTQKRYEKIFSKYPIARELKLVQRPSFVNGTTDSREYSIYEWHKKDDKFMDSYQFAIEFQTRPIEHLNWR